VVAVKDQMEPLINTTSQETVEVTAPITVVEITGMAVVAVQVLVVKVLMEQILVDKAAMVEMVEQLLPAHS
jgi:hypothetical protein